MKAILTLAFKDIRLQTRDYFGLFWIMVFPLLYALFFGAVFSGATGGKGRALTIAVIDEEDSAGSRAFLERLEKSPALKLEAMSQPDAHQAVLKGKLVAYLVIKGGFGDGGVVFGPPGSAKKLELAIDPSRQADAGFLKGILMEKAFADIAEMFSDPQKGRELASKSLKLVPLMPPGIDKDAFGSMMKQMERFLDSLPAAKGDDTKGQAGGALVDLKETPVSVSGEGPRNAFEISFPQSILWGLMGCVASFSISIVIERNQGTFLRLRTSPLTWMQVLAGKGLACFLTSAFVIAALLAVASFILGVRLGNLPLLGLAVIATATCFTGLMLLFSTLGKTEAGVAGSGWGIMMPMAMIGGGMIPLIAMPDWMQTASNFSPVKWGIYALEGAIWRGFSLEEMLLPAAILIAVGVVGFTLGVWKLSKE